MATVAPRSIWIHCGSEKALAQRVPALPSTAFVAAVPPFSTEEAVTGLPCEISGPAACAVETSGETVAYDRSIATAVKKTMRRRRVSSLAAMRVAGPADRVMVMLLGSSQKAGGCTDALATGRGTRAGV